MIFWKSFQNALRRGTTRPGGGVWEQPGWAQSLETVFNGECFPSPPLMQRQQDLPIYCISFPLQCPQYHNRLLSPVSSVTLNRPPALLLSPSALSWTSLSRSIGCRTIEQRASSWVSCSEMFNLVVWWDLGRWYRGNCCIRWRYRGREGADVAWKYDIEGGI